VPFNLGGTELVFILVIVLIVFGAGRLPDVLDQLGRGVRTFRDLVALAESRPNLIPILGDAERPDPYAPRVGVVDVLYQDVAQRDQTGIFLRNAPALRPGGVGILMLKARSEDVAADPRDVARRAESALAASGLSVLDARPLDPFAEGHAAIVVRRN